MNRLFPRNAALILVTLVAACSPSAYPVVSDNVPMASYSRHGCNALVQETSRVGIRLAALNGVKYGARPDDTVAYSTVGQVAQGVHPGDVAPELRRLRGQERAIQEAMVARNCQAALTP